MSEWCALERNFPCVQIPIGQFEMFVWARQSFAAIFMSIKTVAWLPVYRVSLLLPAIYMQISIQRNVYDIEWMGWRHWIWIDVEWLAFSLKEKRRALQTNWFSHPNQLIFPIDFFMFLSCRKAHPHVHRINSRLFFEFSFLWIESLCFLCFAWQLTEFVNFNGRWFTECDYYSGVSKLSKMSMFARKKGKATKQKMNSRNDTMEIKAHQWIHWFQSFKIETIRRFQVCNKMNISPFVCQFVERNRIRSY